MPMNYILILIDQNVDDKAERLKNPPCIYLFNSKGRSTKYIGVKIPCSTVKVPL
jgi:hypothetical protein